MAEGWKATCLEIEGVLVSCIGRKQWADQGRAREVQERGCFFFSFVKAVPGLREQSACCNGYWRSESGKGGLFHEDWVFVSY